MDNFDGYIGDIETSTAQSISIIFAFIAGVIRLARENDTDENKKKTVCDTLPKVAEQVIIFIKDTDGEIAEENMGNRVGARYLFDKINEFETQLAGR